MTQHNQTPTRSQARFTSPLPHGSPVVYLSQDSSYLLPHRPASSATPTSTPAPPPSPVAAPTTAAPTTAAPMTDDRPCCPMPYFPDTGVDIRLHSQEAGKFFYVVKEGRVKGTYTSDAIATAQVKKYSGFSMRAVATYDAALAEWFQHCLDTHGAICPHAPKTTAESRSASPTPSLDSVDSYTSSQLSDVYDLGAGARRSCQTQATQVRGYGGTPSQPPPSTSSRPPVTMETRIFLPADESYALDEGKYWGVPGVLSTYSSRAEAVEAARRQGIARPNIWGHADKRIVDDFISSAMVSE
ncbi:hypothetical protein B0H16DRAFT_1731757 [Mycena metata]|uniref:Uncharacterized protein n=1 Tax=Mycena metata TaxID=1033252 RepID=A0AAD7I3P2_9AGAR|nr:hypothetical protein B0H16DRAFT_1731757 [Mycena metata]